MKQRQQAERRRGATRRLAAAFLGLLMPVALQAQTPFDTTETWSGADLSGWSGGGDQAVLTNASGHLELQFTKQAYPTPAACIAGYALTEAVLVSNLSFRFLADGALPSSVRVQFRSRAGAQWYLPVAGMTRGEWVTASVPVEYPAGWTFGPRATEARFEQDRLSVEWVAVTVMRDASTGPQSYGIDDFRIQGTQIPRSLTISGTVRSGGEQEGAVHVRAESADHPAEANGAAIPAPGAYGIDGLPGAKDYRVTAFLDANANGVQDFWEAAGAATGSPVRVMFTDVEGVGIDLLDPRAPDGLPYWWLKRHFDVADPGAGPGPSLGAEDADRDGMSNQAEYRAGTHPRDPASRFEVTLDIETGPDGLSQAVLRWSSAARRAYSVMTAGHMEDPFVPCGTGLTGNPPTNEFREWTTNANARFYRIRLND